MATAGKRRGTRRCSTIKTAPDPAKIGPLLREAGFAGSERDPISCVATFDPAGNPLRVSARYEDGWRCEMRLRKNRTYSLTQSLTIAFTSKGGALAEAAHD